MCLKCYTLTWTPSNNPAHGPLANVWSPQKHSAGTDEFFCTQIRYGTVAVPKMYAMRMQMQTQNHETPF